LAWLGLAWLGLSQPTNQPTNQPINQPSNQPTKQPNNQPNQGNLSSNLSPFACLHKAALSYLYFCIFILIKIRTNGTLASSAEARDLSFALAITSKSATKQMF
jgi:hypothetical protein